MSQTFAAELLPGEPSLPLVVTPADPRRRSRRDVIKGIKSDRDWIEQKVHEHGAVLFRGYDLDTPKDFEKVARTAVPELKPYVEGQSPRTKIRGNVYTSTEYPKQLRITLHSELSYTKEPPKRLLFYCETAATEGGETPIVDCRRVYQEMPAAVREKFETLKVKYVKNMPDSEKGLGKTWMDHFESTDKKQVERYLDANEISWTWLDDGSLRTESVRPAVRKHPVTGETVWYNQANLWHVSNFEEHRRKTLLQICGEERLPTHCYYGDGSKIEDADLDAVRGVMWDNAVAFPWQQGDLLVVDNILVAHGRMPFDGPRKVLVAMG